MKLLLAINLLAVASAAQAAPLTVRTAETWLFTIDKGEPANARKVDSSAKPAKGQLMISVRAMMGTAMIVTNNSPVAYTFRAELLRGGKAEAARTCTLPGKPTPIFEQWPQKADAVRIGAFRPTGPGGNC